VAQDRPRDVAILQLRHAYFAGEGAVGFVEDVLSRDFYPRAEVLAREEEVEGGRGDDDFGVAVAGGRVEVGDYVFDCGDCAVPADRTKLVGREGMCNVVRVSGWGGGTF
jgi:hypothetical protein